MGSFSRSRSYVGGHTQRSQSPSVMSGSCVSRLDTNQSMRERAASMWLDQLKQAHDRRQGARMKKQEIDQMQVNHTIGKIQRTEMQAERTAQRQQVYQHSRSEAFQGRQEYLKEAKEHAEYVQRLKAHAVEQETSVKLREAEENHKKSITQRVVSTHQKAEERHTQVQQNRQMMGKMRQSVHKSKQMSEEQKKTMLQDRKRQEEEERLAVAQEKEAQRAEALNRASQIAAMKRMSVQAKLSRDTQRSSSVLRHREQWLQQRQEQNQERAEQSRMSIQQAQHMRKAKEQQYANHFEESLAIGRETAEHNKMFKLNNKVMHEVC